MANIHTKALINVFFSLDGVHASTYATLPAALHAVAVARPSRVPAFVPDTAHSAHTGAIVAYALNVDTSVDDASRIVRRIAPSAANSINPSDIAAFTKSPPSFNSTRDRCACATMSVVTPTTIDVHDACAFCAAFARLDGGMMASERRAVKASRLVGGGVVFQGGGEY